MQASPSTGQPSKDVLLIKCLELGVVIGMAMACCSVTNACCSVTKISHLRHPLVPRCSVKKITMYNQEDFPFDNEFSALKVWK